MHGQASTIAGPVDALFTGVTLVAVLFSLAIAVAIIFLAVKYRRGNKADRSNPPQYNHIIEVAWTGIPLLIALGIFVWSATLYLSFRHIPRDATEIYVVGKQWMWKLQHPEGRWEMNELHIPVNRPVQLVMTSEDVIHAFFVPAFRLKQDVIPGQYTRMWFKPTKVGTYHLFCAEFCGTLHSRMTGTVTVMEQADYEAWLAGGNQALTSSAVGQRLFIQNGCNGCHGPNSSVRAPLLDGIFGKPIPVQIPKPGQGLETTPATTIIADQRYIHDAIVLPDQEVAAGYKPIMPTFKNRITEEQILQITAYIRSLGTRGGGKTEGTRNQGGQRQSTSLSEEEYKTRVGFTPENIKSLTAGQSGTAPGGATGPSNRPRNNEGMIQGSTNQAVERTTR